MPASFRLAAACLLAVSGSTLAQGVASCPSPIPFGLTTPLTGGVALLGVQARLGLEEAVDEINEAGGIAGKKIKLSVEDATSAAPNALNSFNRLMDDKPVVMFTSMISPHVFTENDAIVKGGTPVITAGTNAALVKQNDPWLVRVHVHDGQLADAIPNYVVETLKKSKPAVISVADDYGLAASRGIQARFEALRIKPVAVESYGLNDKDMSAQLTKIKDAGADVIVVFGRPGDVALVMKQRHALGIATPVIGNSSAVAATTLANLTADEADGSMGIGGVFPQVTPDAKAQAFAKAVLDKNKIPADNFALAYRDAAYLLRDIIAKVGCDRTAIRDQLKATKGWKGLLTTYTADADGDLAHTMGIYRNKGKTTELVRTINEKGF